MGFRILIPLTIEMINVKHSNDWPCSFEEVKNVVLLTHYEGRRSFATGHLSDTGDLKLNHEC